jgi:hypothetical protein
VLLGAELDSRTARHAATQTDGVCVAGSEENFPASPAAIRQGCYGACGAALCIVNVRLRIKIKLNRSAKGIFRTFR